MIDKTEQVGRLPKVLTVASVLLSCLSSHSVAYPLRNLQSTVIEPGTPKSSGNQSIECAEGDKDCETKTDTQEVDEEGLNDTTLISIIIGTILVLIVCLTVGVVVY